jgi:hypothetical protein
VFDPGRDPRLAVEPLPALLAVGEVGAHRLDDPDLVHQAVADLVDRAHSTLSDPFEDLVFPFKRPERFNRHALPDYLES